MRWRRFGLIGLGAFLGGILALFLALQTSFVQSRLADYLVRMVSSWMTEGELRVERFELRGLSRVELGGVSLRDGQGREHLGLRDLDLLWSPWALVNGELQIEELALGGLELQLVEGADGQLELLKLFDMGGDPGGDGGLDWSVERFHVAALSVRYLPQEGVPQGLRVSRASASLWGSGADWGAEAVEIEGLIEGDGGFEWILTGDTSSVGGDLQFKEIQVETPYAALGFSGTLTEQRRLDLQGQLERIDLEEMGIGQGRFAGNFSLKGPLNWANLSVSLAGEEEDLGQLKLDASASLEGGEPLWKLSLETKDFHLEPFVESLDESVVVSGRVFVHGLGTSWPEDLSAEIYALLDKPLQLGDQQLAALEMQGHLSHGRLQIASLESTVPEVASLRGHGDIDLVGGAMLAKLYGDVVPSQFGLGGTGRISVTLSGNAYEPPLAVAGALQLMGASWGEGLDARRLSLRGRVMFEEEGVRFHGTGRGRQINAYGGIIDSLTLSSLQGVSAEGQIELQWKGSLDSLHWGEGIHGESVQTEGSLSITKEHSRLDLVGVIGPMRALDFSATHGALRVQQQDSELTLFLDLFDDTRAMVSVEAIVDLEAQRMRLPRLLLAPTARITWEGSGEEALGWSDSGLSGLRLALRSPQGRLSLQGDLDRNRPLTAKLFIEDFSLDVLAELFPSSVGGLAGKLDAEVSLSGSAEDPNLIGSFAGQRLWLPGISRALDLDGSWDFSGGLLRTQARTTIGDTELLTLEAVVPLSLDWTGAELRPGDPLRCDLYLPPLQIGFLRPLVPALASWPEGRMGGALSLSGSLESPQLRGNGVAELELLSLRDTARLEWGLTQSADRLEGSLGAYLGHREHLYTEFEAQSFLREHLMALTGVDKERSSEDWLGDMRITGVLSDLDVVDALALSGTSLPISGRVEGKFVVEGKPLKPRISGNFRWTDGRLGSEPFEEARLELKARPGGNEVDFSWRFNDEAQVQISGDVPVALDLSRASEEWFPEGLALAIEGPGLPIGVASIFDPGIVDSEGIIRLWGAIGGSLLAPRGRVTIRSEGGSLWYSPLNLRLDKLSLSAELNEEVLILDSFRARTLPARDWLSAVVEEQSSVVELTGSFGLDGSIKSQLRLEDAWLAATHNLRLRLNGGVDVSGNWPHLEIIGSPGLDLVQGKVVLDATAFVARSALSLDPAIHTHRGVEERRVVRQTSSWTDDLVVALPIALNRNLETDITMPFVEDMGGLGAVVSSMNLTARLGSVQAGEGQLVLSMDDGELSLKGDVEVIEGKISVLQTRFNLTEGALRYLGGPIYDPALDITGEASSSYDLTVQITGSPGTPKIVLSSETYPDSAEQMTILLTGRAPEDLTHSEGEFVASSLAGMLLNSVFTNLEIGSLSVEPDGSIRVGLPLSNQLYAESFLNFQPDLGDNHVTLELEWTLLPRLLLLTSLGEQKSGADLLWEYRF
jgi:hypothetical protein